MKTSKQLLLVLLFTLICISCNENQNNLIQENVKTKFNALSGSYLGQETPGIEPQIFAPHIISTGYDEACISINSNTKEIFYSIGGKPQSVILYTKEANGKWTSPIVVPFSGK